MAPSVSPDRLLIDRIRGGDSEAWEQLIVRFEGRLLAFVESRLRSRATSEDVVQETFVGFLTSLPNYDLSRSLESYLFSIAAHKLTDHLRREGRRPTVPLSTERGSQGEWDPASSDRSASTMLRSVERRGLEADSLAAAIGEQIDRWRRRGDWEKLRCVELLFCRGMANKDVATALGISEQTVANYKFDFLAKLRHAIRKQDLSEDVFPELHESRRD